MHKPHTDWFQALTGFAETDYASTQARLHLEGEWLHGAPGARPRAVGRLTLPTLGELRALALPQGRGRNRVQVVVGNARQLHAQSELQGALFQVASQFNLLEMVSPRVSPEDGVTRYQGDPTQGPACAMAAGAATVYRNYLVEWPGSAPRGQTRERQIDTLAGVGARLAEATGLPAERLWRMRNGYALAHPEGLAAVATWLHGASVDERAAIENALAIGLHEDVEVTDLHDPQPHRVAQAFCSAVPVAYSDLPAAAWEPLARLVLRAAYEATLRCAASRAAAGGSPVVLLTRLGGGAFGNRDEWIDDALDAALAAVQDCGLQVQLVSYGQAHPGFTRLARRWG